MATFAFFFWGSVSGLQFDGDAASEVELAGSLCATEVPVSKGSGAAVAGRLGAVVAGWLGTVAAGWSGAVTAGCFLGRPTERFSA